MSRPFPVLQDLFDHEIISTERLPLTRLSRSSKPSYGGIDQPLPLPMPWLAAAAMQTTRTDTHR